jgi:hypothetical protein
MPQVSFIQVVNYILPYYVIPVPLQSVSQCCEWEITLRNSTLGFIMHAENT